jgi:ankyrin repeat protein
VTPLHYAAKSGNSELVVLLIDRGASVDALTIANETPSHWAAQSGNSEIIALLMGKGASVK